ncbi:hypothetical protein BpHYR1_031570 [Brachionus plicatilis]|uniref:Uncharacterized protein n=1 Tax=Brachionus plicatilis TaxID=10195 RepID=A0A3M7QGM8_BRAPC|nr:hypothetical protein BpHYR1_031570 [Brachionus plicatilis]
MDYPTVKFFRCFTEKFLKEQSLVGLRISKDNGKTAQKKSIMVKIVRIKNIRSKRLMLDYKIERISNFFFDQKSIYQDQYPMHNRGCEVRFNSIVSIQLNLNNYLEE